MLRILALIILMMANSAEAMPLGGNPPSIDQLAICLAPMAANTWQDAANCVGTNTTVNSVAWNCSAQPCSSNGEPGTPSDASTTITLTGSSGVNGTIDDWGGGTYDSDHGLLLVWGGGHQGYYGNEIYGFNIKTLQWQRMTAPSSLNTFTKGTSAQVLPDGQPVASHTYGDPVYVPGVGLFQLGTCGRDTGGCVTLAWFQTVSGMSKFAYNHWQAISNVPALIGGLTVSSFDPNANRIYTWGGDNFTPPQFLPSPYTSPTAWGSTGGNGTASTNGSNFGGAVQPGVQFVIAGIGAGIGTNFSAASVATGNSITFTATGDTSITSCTAPGLEWDGTSGQFLGWCGGKNVVLLNPSTYNFSLHTVGGGITPTCSESVGPGGCTSATGTNSNGTRGRFRCLRPTYNACIVVNTVSDHVFIYKPDF